VRAFKLRLNNLRSEGWLKKGVVLTAMKAQVLVGEVDVFLKPPLTNPIQIVQL
jgi:hypothetical protein